MSTSSRATPSASVSGRDFTRSRVRSTRATWLPWPWSPYAWGAIAATSTFIAITCWWLTQDRGIPIYDAGDQLETALLYRSMLHAGNLFEPFTYNNVYPILAHMVGAVAALIGGVSVSAPIIGENLVFVPLLALGVYRLGRLLFGPLAGTLAVAFVLGSPLLISLFHVFMLDAPETAMVAVSVWLLLASEDFKRMKFAGFAGLAVGLGLNVKVQFALFLVGLTAILLLHGGWRNWRGFALFCAVALLVGTPWYIEHSSELSRMLSLASSGPGTPEGNIPQDLSVTNLLWYFWSVLNSQLLLPLALLAAGGLIWTLRDVIRDRGKNAARLEFFAGGLVAWLIITFATPHHDIRYGLPLLGLLAVVGTGWIVSLPRAARTVALALLVLGVLANTLTITFGVGQEVKFSLTSHPAETEQFPDRVVIFLTDGFLSAAPNRDGDVPGLMEALHREGVTTLSWSAEQSEEPDFSSAGLQPLAAIAELQPAETERPEFGNTASVATLIHEPVNARPSPPCTRLSDGTGVWVARYDESVKKLAYYCPSRSPRYYDPGSVK